MGAICLVQVNDQATLSADALLNGTKHGDICPAESVDTLARVAYNKQPAGWSRQGFHNLTLALVGILKLID
jgi:hypothetical protein